MFFSTFVYGSDFTDLSENRFIVVFLWTLNNILIIVLVKIIKV